MSHQLATPDHPPSWERDLASEFQSHSPEFPSPHNLFRSPPPTWLAIALDLPPILYTAPEGVQLFSPSWLDLLPSAEQRSHHYDRTIAMHSFQASFLPYDRKFLPTHHLLFHTYIAPAISAPSAAIPRWPDYYPFLLLAEITSYAPPLHLPPYIDVFGPPVSHPHPIAPRSTPLSCHPLSCDWTIHATLFAAPPPSDPSILIHTIDKWLRTAPTGILLLPLSPLTLPHLTALRALPSFTFSIESADDSHTALYFRIPVPDHTYPFPPLSVYPPWPDSRPPLTPSPLNWQYWTSFTRSLHDDEFIHTVTSAFSVGRTIHYHGPRTPIAKPNWPIPDHLHSHVTKQIDADCSDTILIPVPTPLPSAHPIISPMSVKVKRINNKPRTVTDPTATHINEHIDKTYMFSNTTDHARNGIRILGQNTLLLKTDIKSAYNTNLIAPSDLHLHYTSWKDRTFCKRTHQWGFSSAGFTWADTAFCFAHILTTLLSLFLYYFVDDFLILIPPTAEGLPDYATAYRTASNIARIARLLGITLAKWELGTNIVFLGVLFNTVTMRLSLPLPRLSLIHTDLTTILKAKKSITLHHLESVLGSVEWLARVCRSARPLTQGIILALSQRAHSDSRSHRFIFLRVSRALKLATQRIAFLVERLLAGELHRFSLCDIFSRAPYHLWSDASIAAGAIVLREFGFARFTWPPALLSLLQRDIASLEALALAIAVCTLYTQPSFDPSRHLIIGLDSESVILAAIRGRSATHHISLTLDYIIYNLNIDATYIHIDSHANPADPPSRFPITQILFGTGVSLRAITPIWPAWIGSSLS